MGLRHRPCRRSRCRCCCWGVRRRQRPYSRRPPAAWVGGRPAWPSAKALNSPTRRQPSHPSVFPVFLATGKQFTVLEDCVRGGPSDLPFCMTNLGPWPQPAPNPEEAAPSAVAGAADAAAAAARAALAPAKPKGNRFRAQVPPEAPGQVNGEATGMGNLKRCRVFLGLACAPDVSRPTATIAFDNEGGCGPCARQQTAYLIEVLRSLGSCCRCLGWELALLRACRPPPSCSQGTPGCQGGGPGELKIVGQGLGSGALGRAVGDTAGHQPRFRSQEPPPLLPSSGTVPAVPELMGDGGAGVAGGLTGAGVP